LASGGFFQSRFASTFAWGKFVLHRGAIYKLVRYLSLSRNFDVPQVARYKGQALQSVADIPTAPNQWFYDAVADTLYLWLPDNTNPQITRDSGALTIFDWRPLMEEIIQVMKHGDSWTWRRLAHHRSQWSGWGTQPGGNVDPTGTFVLVQSNWDGTLRNADGSLRTDAFLLFVPRRRESDVCSTFLPVEVSQ
jgi:hypothetical protein